MSNVYTKLFLKKEKQEKIYGFLILLILMGISLFFSFFSKKELQYKIRGKKSKIDFITLANISPSQVTVVWKTAKEEESSVFFGESPDKLVNHAIDELTGEKQKGLYHYSNLVGLEPDRDYFFAVKIGNELIGLGKEPFKFHTPYKFLPSNIPPLIGKIEDKNGKPLGRKVVFLQIKDCFPLAGITGEKGEWVIPLGLVFDIQGKKKREISRKSKFELKVLGEDLTARGSLDVFMNYQSPLVVGKDYIFELSSKEFLKRKKIGKSKKYKVLLIYPRPGSKISNAKPLIKGKGVPYENVFVEIEARKKIILKTQVDEEGYWHANLPLRLDVGKYLIKIKTKDINGKNIELIRDFYITKSGETVLSVSTSSASLTAIPTPTSTPTLTPTPTSVDFASTHSQSTPTSIRSLSKREVSPSPPVSGIFPYFSIFTALLFLSIGGLLLLK